MNDDTVVTNSRTLSIINFILGIWLVISPYILNYATDQARVQQTVVGIAIAILAAVTYYVPSARWASWVNAVLALWLVIAPFVTAYQSAAAYWNEIITAIIIGVLSVWNAGLNVGGVHHTRGHAA